MIWKIQITEYIDDDEFKKNIIKKEKEIEELMKDFID